MSARPLNVGPLSTYDRVGSPEASKVSEVLIQQLQRRIRSEPAVDMVNIVAPIRPRSPVSDEVVSRAEAQLGFPLPPLLRAMYTRVADGGYGPGYGILQLTNHELSVVASRRRMDAEIAGEAVRPWPERFVELANWGCNLFSGVDCSRPELPVLFFNNDGLADGSAIADNLLPEADSLEEWLSRWLRGKDLWADIERLRQPI